VLPVVSTGGATLSIADRMSDIPVELGRELDFVSAFHKSLGVSVREERFKRPEDQPLNIEDRYWHPPDEPSSPQP